MTGSMWINSENRIVFVQHSTPYSSLVSSTASAPTAQHNAACAHYNIYCTTTAVKILARWPLYFFIVLYGPSTLSYTYIWRYLKITSVGNNNMSPTKCSSQLDQRPKKNCDSDAHLAQIWPRFHARILVQVTIKHWTIYFHKQSVLEKLQIINFRQGAVEPESLKTSSSKR